MTRFNKNLSISSIEEKIKNYRITFPVLVENYKKYYMVNKEGYDGNNMKNQLEGQWDRMSQDIFALEALLRNKINVRGQNIENKTQQIKEAKKLYNTKKPILMNKYNKASASNPFKKSIYDEQTKLIIYMIFYITGILTMGGFFYKQIKLI